MKHSLFIHINMTIQYVLKTGLVYYSFKRKIGTNL